MLTLQYVPYSEIELLSSDERIEKLLDIVKSQSIVLMQGRLKPSEETKLIQKTMETIDKDFKGVEICTIFPEDKDLQAFRKVKKEMIKFVMGNREGITIVGPANIIKEIKKDPNKIQLLTVVPPTKKVKRGSSKKTSKRKE